MTEHDRRASAERSAHLRSRAVGARHAASPPALRGGARCGFVFVWVSTLLAFATVPARAAEDLRQNLVTLAATATADLPLDTLSVTLRVQREAADAPALQAQLKRVLDTALAEVRPEARPDALEVSTGAFHLSPRYGRDGKANGWSGFADLQLQGRDVPRVAAAAGRIEGMVISSTAYSLSRQAREKAETDLAAQAIQKFRSRADDVARQFGFSGYTLREVNLHSAEQEGGGRPPIVALRAAAPAMADASPMPTEAGKGSLSVTVQGSVQLTR